MALETVSEWKLARETILDYVRRHPGCRMQDVAAKTKYTYEEIARAVEGMGRLERWESYGTQHLYVSGTHIPMPTSKTPEKHDRHIAAYLDAFDEFCDEVMERYDQEVIGELTPEAMISLYRGFLTALPDIERAGGRK